jgi:DNA-binding transcriptional ArsR family regulator
MAQLFKTLGDETRLRILYELQQGPKNVTALVKKLKMPQPSVSHHLALLRMSDLVSTERSGKSIIYSINAEPVRYEKAVRQLVDQAGLKIGHLVLGLTK